MADASASRDGGRAAASREGGGAAAAMNAENELQISGMAAASPDGGGAAAAAMNAENESQSQIIGTAAARNAESESQMDAERVLESWFQEQLTAADALLREQASGLSALRAEMERPQWGRAVQSVVEARQALEDARAALGDALARMTAALRLPDATDGLPRSECLHGAGRSGRRAAARLPSAVEHARGAQDHLSRCAVRVRSMVHWNMDGEGGDDDAERDRVTALRNGGEVTDAATALATAVDRLTVASHATADACAQLHGSSPLSPSS